MRPLRAAARDTAIRDFDLESCILPQWLALIDTLAAGGTPPEQPPSDGLATHTQLR